MALSMLTTWRLAVTPEPVTLERRAVADGPLLPVAVPHAKRRALTGTQEDQLGLKEVVWHLWRDGYAGPAPKREDRVLDAQGVRWVVYQVEIQSGGVRYRLSTRRAVTPP